MKKRITSILTGIFATAFVCSAGSAIYFAQAEETAGTEQSVLTMQNGASIRYFEPVGIRFVTDIAKDKYAEIMTADENATFGTLILPCELLAEDKTLTIENTNAVNIVAEKWLEDTETTKSFTGVLVGTENEDGTYQNFPAEYYDKDLYAVSYCSYSGTTVYAANPQTYSVAYIASALLARGDTDNLLYEITDAVLKDGISFAEETPKKIVKGETATTTLNGAKGLKAVYTSSDEKVATVNEKGEIAAIEIGETTITATIGNQTAAVNVKIIPDESAILFDKEYNGYTAKFTSHGYDIVSNYFGTLSNTEQHGALNMDITFSKLGTAATDTFGIVFGATVGQDFPQTGLIWRSENTSYYYFAINSSGGWTLYKMIGKEKSFGIKSGTWLQSYGEELATDKTYSFRVACTQVRNRSEKKELAVWVDGKPFCQGLDEGSFGGAALNGTEWGVRNVGFRCNIAKIDNSEVVIDRISYAGGSVRSYLAAQDGYQTVNSAFSLFNIKEPYGTLTADIYLKDTMTGHFGIVCGADIADDFPGTATGSVWQSPASTYYYICFNGKNNTWNITKVSGAARTQVATNSEWISSAAEDWKTKGIKLTVAYTEAGRIVVSIDGVTVLDYTDEAPYTGTEWGLSSVAGGDRLFTISNIEFEKKAVNDEANA